VLLILLVLTSLLTYLVRLLHRKVIKLHFLCTVWNFRLFFPSQHLDLKLNIVDDQSLIFSAVFLLVDQSLVLSLNKDHYHTMTERKKRRRQSNMMMIIIISQDVDIMTFHLTIYIKMSIVTNKIDK
jgi:hypothetical protein